MKIETIAMAKNLSRKPKTRDKSSGDFASLLANLGPKETKEIPQEKTTKDSLVGAENRDLKEVESLEREDDNSHLLALFHPANKEWMTTGLSVEMVNDGAVEVSPIELVDLEAETLVDQDLLGDRETANEEPVFDIGDLLAEGELEPEDDESPVLEASKEDFQDKLGAEPKLRNQTERKPVEKSSIGEKQISTEDIGRKESIRLEEISIDQDLESPNLEPETEKEIDIKKDYIRGDNLFLNARFTRPENIIGSSKLDYNPMDFALDNMEVITDSIIDSIEITNIQGSSTMEVQLYPEELGALNIKLRLEDGKLTGKILVDNEAVKALLANSVNDLNINLAKANISIEKLDIDVNPNFNENLNANDNPKGNENPRERFAGNSQRRFRSNPRVGSQVGLENNLGEKYHLGGSSLSILV